MALKPVQQRTTSSIIADEIRDAVLDGTFRPGAQLGEAQLAAELNVSRGPVREALQRLIAEGLLRNERNRGVFVVELTQEDVNDVYLARSSVEHAAAQQLTRAQDTAVFDTLDAHLDEMAAVVETGEWGKVAQLDWQFHEALVAATGSARLQRMFRTLLGETRLCLLSLEAAYPQRRDAVDEHRRIVAAMRSGDTDQVRDVLDAHFEHAIENIS